MAELSIRDRALAAHLEYEERAREATRERLEAESDARYRQTRDFLIGLLGSIPAGHSVASTGTIEIEGIVFSGPRVKGRCPTCDAWTVSDRIDSLAELYFAINDFRPGPGHEHDYGGPVDDRPDPAPAPTLGNLIDRLVERIEAIESDLYS